MKNLSLILTVILLAGCSGMRSSDSGMQGSSSDTSGTSATNPSDQSPNVIDDLRSRDRAKDLYFGS